MQLVPSWNLVRIDTADRYPVLDDEHCLVRLMSAGERQFVQWQIDYAWESSLEKEQIAIEAGVAYSEVTDEVSPEAEANDVAWVAVLDTRPDFFATTQSVLELCRLPGDALDCLKGYPRRALSRHLAGTALKATWNGACQKTSLKAALVRWLQTATWCKETCVFKLVGVMRAMCGAGPLLVYRVDWSKEGF